MVVSGFYNDMLCGLVQTLCLNDRPSPYYIPVPLTSVHVNVEVVNFCSKVEITHQFVNKERDPIECIYFFPVEEEAAVVEFTARLQGREIKTVVKEKKEARANYNLALQNRQTAFLLEETKPDIFEMKVGYLSPGESASVSITYLTELPVEEGKTKLTIPTTVAPRYVPRQDDNPEVARKISSIQHDFTSPAKMTMALAVLMRTQIISIASPSHQLATPTKKIVGEFFQADTAFLGKVNDMDRDLVVLIQSDEPNRPTVIVEKNGEGSTAAMLSFVPQFRLKDQKVEVVFLVDCSGSMNGNSMDLAKEALQVFLHSLPLNSFFNVVRFGSSFEYLFSHSRPYDDSSLKEAKASVLRMSADLGGTEIYQPLELILRMTPMVGSPRQVFVITDGQVSNSTACIDLVKKFSNMNRVFTLGVGSSADRHLVKGMARAGQGTALFTAQGESLTAKVINQLKNGLQPCIAEVNVNWGKFYDNPQQESSQVAIEMKKTLFGYGKPLVVVGKNQFSMKHQAPEKIPAIYDGSRLLVYKLLDGSISSDDVILIKASTPEGELQLEVPVNKNSFIYGDSVHKLFARKMIQDIEENYDQNDTEGSKKFITDLCLKFQVVSKFTSFVGVDERQRDVGNVLITRPVKNQLPQNSASGFARFGSTGVSATPFGKNQLPQNLARLDPRVSTTPSLSLGQPPVAHRGATAKSFCFGGFGAASMPGLSGASSMAGFGGFGAASMPTVDGTAMGQPVCQLSMGQLNSVTEPLTGGGSTFSGSVSIASYQTANGSFPADQDLAQALGTNLQTLLEEGKKANPSNFLGQNYIITWITALVVCHLKTNFNNEKDIWELIVDKAEKWLKDCGVGFVSVYLEKAQQFVNSQRTGAGGLEKKSTCPLGHPLVELKVTDGGAWFCNSKEECIGGCNDGGNHIGVAVWRCTEDWRVKQGGTCDFDLCGPCMGQK